MAWKAFNQMQQKEGGKHILYWQNHRLNSADVQIIAYTVILTYSMHYDRETIKSKDIWQW